MTRSMGLEQGQEKRIVIGSEKASPYLRQAIAGKGMLRVEEARGWLPQHHAPAAHGCAHSCVQCNGVHHSCGGQQASQGSMATHHKKGVSLQAAAATSTRAELTLLPLLSLTSSP